MDIDNDDDDDDGIDDELAFYQGDDKARLENVSAQEIWKCGLDLMSDGPSFNKEREDRKSEKEGAKVPHSTV